PATLTTTVRSPPWAARVSQMCGAVRGCWSRRSSVVTRGPTTGPRPRLGSVAEILRPERRAVGADRDADPDGLRVAVDDVLAVTPVVQPGPGDVLGGREAAGQVLRCRIAVPGLAHPVVR